MLIKLGILFALLKLTLSSKKVLLAQYEPHINCSLDQTYFEGVDYEFFKDIIKELNTSIDEIQFICEDFYIMLDRILNNETDILCSIGGITINEDRIQSGYKFTTSYFDTGISLLIEAKPQNWTFLQFFSYDFVISWLCLCIITLSIMVWWFDGQYLSLLEYIWHSLGHLFINGAFSHRQSLSKLLDYCQLIYSVIFTLIFTSMIIHFYAYKYDLNLVTSTDKAKDKILGTFPGYQVYVDYLLAYPIYQDFINPYDIVEFLENTHVDAIVLDDAFLQICQAEYEYLYVVAQNFMPLDFGIMFPPITDDQIVHEFSKAILKVIQNKPMNQRVADYIKKHYSKSKREKNLLNKTVYRLSDFYEIWFVYSIGIAISFSITLINEFGLNTSRKNMKIIPFKSRRGTDISMINKEYSEKMTSSSTNTTKSPLFHKRSFLSNQVKSFEEFLEGASIIRQKILERISKKTRGIEVKNPRQHLGKGVLAKEMSLRNKKGNFIGLRERSNKRTIINLSKQIHNRIYTLISAIEDIKDIIALNILKRMIIIQYKLKKHIQSKRLKFKRYKSTINLSTLPPSRLHHPFDIS